MSLFYSPNLICGKEYKCLVTVLKHYPNTSARIVCYFAIHAKWSAMDCLHIAPFSAVDLNLMSDIFKRLNPSSIKTFRLDLHPIGQVLVVVPRNRYRFIGVTLGVVNETQG
jgi:hypothetical protein